MTSLRRSAPDGPTRAKCRGADPARRHLDPTFADAVDPDRLGAKLRVYATLTPFSDTLGVHIHGVYESGSTPTPS